MAGPHQEALLLGCSLLFVLGVLLLRRNFVGGLPRVIRVLSVTIAIILFGWHQLSSASVTPGSVVLVLVMVVVLTMGLFQATHTTTPIAAERQDTRNIDEHTT
jgi:hypothetical protein